MLSLDFRLADWITRNISSAKHNLSNSGLPFPNLVKMGIDTSFENFENESECSSMKLIESIANIYNVRPGNIVPTAGGTEGIFLVNAFLQERVNRIFVPVPEYEPMFTVPLALGMETVTESFEHILHTIEDGDGIAFTNPNNPTGNTVEDSLLERILKKPRESDIVLYIDETFREFMLPEKSSTLYDGSENIITSNTMTKFYGIGGLRVGWIIASEENVQKLWKMKMLTSASISNFSMWIASQILDNRDKFVGKIKTLKKRNIKIAQEIFDSIPDVEWSYPNSALFGFVRYRDHIDSISLAKKAMENKSVLISPGAFFGEDHSFRVCLTSEPDQLQEDLSSLAVFLKEEFR